MLTLRPSQKKCKAVCQIKPNHTKNHTRNIILTAVMVIRLSVVMMISIPNLLVVIKWCFLHQLQPTFFDYFSLFPSHPSYQISLFNFCHQFRTKIPISILEKKKLKTEIRQKHYTLLRKINLKNQPKKRLFTKLMMY